MAATELASPSGAQAGLGLWSPFRVAPRLSMYLRANASYYIDDRPGASKRGAAWACRSCSERNMFRLHH